MAEQKEQDIPRLDDVPMDDAEFLAYRNWVDAAIEDDEWLDETEPFTMPHYTLEIGGVKCCPYGGLHGITGQAGKGKTLAFTQLITAYIRGDWGCIKYIQQDERPNPKVLWVDTEQEKENTQATVARIYYMCGWTWGVPHHDRFRTLRLRNVPQSQERYRKVLHAIWEYKPDVVFLDGLIDLIEDFNDNKESALIIYELLAVASHYGISVWGVLHQNPGTSKMAGHQGSFFERKVTDLAETKMSDKKVNGHFEYTVHWLKNRGAPKDDFSFFMDNSHHHLGIPTHTDDVMFVEEEDPNDELRTKMDRCLPSPVSRNTRELQAELKKEFGIGSTNAHRMIKEAEAAGIITKAINGKFVYVQPKAPKQSHLPFPKPDNEGAPF